jgi:acyl-CoA synthetase (AMP-forming)/AMP-acid ligase II
MTYHQLFKFSKNFAAHLRVKFYISDGDVICVMMHNTPEYAPVLLGATEAGAEVTTVNPIYTACK